MQPGAGLAVCRSTYLRRVTFDELREHLATHAGDRVRIDLEPTAGRWLSTMCGALRVIESDEDRLGLDVDNGEGNVCGIVLRAHDYIDADTSEGAAGWTAEVRLETARIAISAEL